MNWLDILIVLVIGGFTLAAFSAGLIRESITLIAIVAGAVVAGLLHGDLARELFAFMPDEEAALGISFLILFASVFLMGQVLAHTVKFGVSLLMLGPYDRFGGAVFGFAKGFLVVQLLLIIFAAYPGLGFDDAVRGSALAPVFVDHLSFLLKLLPSSIDRRVDAFLAAN
jgi:membrane protein required for colicin V production